MSHHLWEWPNGSQYWIRIPEWLILTLYVGIVVLSECVKCDIMWWIGERRRKQGWGERKLRILYREKVRGLESRHLEAVLDMYTTFFFPTHLQSIRPLLHTYVVFPNNCGALEYDTTVIWTFEIWQFLWAEPTEIFFFLKWRHSNLKPTLVMVIFDHWSSLQRLQGFDTEPPLAVKWRHHLSVPNEGLWGGWAPPSYSRAFSYHQFLCMKGLLVTSTSKTISLADGRWIQYYVVQKSIPTSYSDNIVIILIIQPGTCVWN